MSENRKNIINTTLGSFTNPQVEMTKNVIGIDPWNDILYNHQYIHVRFFESGTTDFEEGLDMTQLYGNQEYVINVLCADIKTIEVMCWEIYMNMAQIFCKHSYLDGVRKWARKEGFEMKPDEEVEFARARWAFEQLECGDFVEKLPIEVKMMRYLNTLIRTTSPKFISLLCKDIKWDLDDRSGAESTKTSKKAVDPGPLSKYATAMSAFPFRDFNRGCSKITQFMKAFGLPSLNKFEDCVNAIIDNYGGDEPGTGIHIDSTRMERVYPDDDGQVEGWGKMKFYTPDQDGHIVEITKANAIPTDYAVLYIKVKVNVKKEKLHLFNKYHHSIENYVIPHWERHRKAISVIDRNFEMDVVTALIARIIGSGGFITSVDEGSIIRSIKNDEGFVYKVKNNIRTGKMLSMKERLEAAKTDSLKPGYDIPPEYKRELELFKAGAVISE